MRLNKVRCRRPARKLASLHLSSKPEPSDLIPVIKPIARLRCQTVATSRRQLPEVRSLPALTACVTKYGHPFEASVPWRSERAPSWSPRPLRESQLFDRARQERAQLAASMSLGSLPLVPRTTLRHPQWNSSQLGMYDEWPKGLLRSVGAERPRWDPVRSPPRAFGLTRSTDGS